MSKRLHPFWIVVTGCVGGAISANVSCLEAPFGAYTFLSGWPREKMKAILAAFFNIDFPYELKKSREATPGYFSEVSVNRLAGFKTKLQKGQISMIGSHKPFWNRSDKWD
jgi:hypothetical protein